MTIPTTAHVTAQKVLNPRHYRECKEFRGLDAQWIAANCHSATAQEVTQYLGYTAQSDGIWLEGCNHQSQFRPDQPWKKEGDKKAPKYRSPLGEYDAMLPTHPHDPHYWDDYEALKDLAFNIDGHPCLVITEGFFKALAGCANGIPTIALLGVEMGLTPTDADPQGKRYLVPTLERYAKVGFGFIFAFDADCAENENVIKAQRKLAHQLQLFKVPVYSVTGLWTVAQGKGMDDYIQNNGSDRYLREVMGKAVDIEAWEKQFQTFDGGNAKTKKAPPADIIAREIAEQYKDKLAYNNEIGRWMRYGADCPGMWSLETDEYIEAIVGGILDGKNITGYGSYSYVTNVVKTLRRLLIVRRWEERSPSELLPFINGVLEVSTGRLLPHSPGYRLTWQLPRAHDPNAADWSGIDAYLDRLSGGNAAIKDVLLCFCNAVLKGRSDLQKFLHLIGLAGSGKGTFARLLTDLIGSDNIYSGTLEDWCGNRFESALAHRKRLVVFWDEDKQTGKLGKFLSLTGGDWIRAEEKGKKGFQYRYDGMVVVCSNLPIFTGDAASRIARRVVTVPCNSSVPVGQRRDLNAEFQPELDAFTNRVLSIPDTYVTKVLMGLADIPECTLEFWENRIRTDSIAAWVNDWAIYDVLAETPVGSNKEEGLEGSPQTLYGSYCLHCKQSGTQAKANKNFSPDLLELCRSVLGWEVERKVTKTGKFIKGLRLRTDCDRDIPTYDYLLLKQVTGGDGSGDGSGDGTESLQDKAFSKGDGSTQTLYENREIENAVEEGRRQRAEDRRGLEGNSDSLEFCSDEQSLFRITDKIKDSAGSLEGSTRLENVLYQVGSGSSQIVLGDSGSQSLLPPGSCLLPSEQSEAEMKPNFSEGVRSKPSPSSKPFVEGTSGPSPPPVTAPVTANAPPTSQQLKTAQTQTLHDANAPTVQVELDLSAQEVLPLVAINTAADGEWTPMSGEQVEVLHQCVFWLATVISCPNNHPDPQQRITGWKVQIEAGFELYVWQLAHMRPLPEESGGNGHVLGQVT